MSESWNEPGWYGIPQFLDSTWDLYGGKPSSAAEQVKLGLDYMRARYGGPRAEKEDVD